MKNSIKLYCPHAKAYTHIIQTNTSAKKIQNIAYKVLNIDGYTYEDFFEALDTAGIKYSVIDIENCIHVNF